jgi:hypothetical protein
MMGEEPDPAKVKKESVNIMNEYIMHKFVLV